MSLRTSELGYSYGETVAVRELDLTINQGEVLAIIGPSGAGKSTVLRLLAMFDPPSQGTVQFDGTDVWTVSPGERRAIRRRIGMVFQSATLFDTTVARNVEYGLTVRQPWSNRLRRLSRMFRTNGTVDSAVKDALSVVGMNEHTERHVDTLSGGEAQRVAFARALCYQPAVLLLDEPTSDLDPRNTATIEQAVTKARDRGIAVVIATHDMHQAERIADRVGVLIDGKLTEIGRASQLFESPTDVRTRQFISGELVYQ